ncbi:MAG: 30S ribosomal protein S3 [Clostridia bacterium]|nr:30S ribosomal protein S3 [Clostridia bacterium]MBO7504218.1 30S ribosomal protein S3 [Clostridia bacterium]MBO7659866.1 30S ribosomal protein S3 [Clostridia bacterium]MBP5666121.1 30S ribosomal protein S3 [Clostridia bacterium]
MGQKVNPHGLRVGIIKDWDSKWYANKKEYSTFLVEDNKVRKFVKTKYYDAGVSRIRLERQNNKLTVNIDVAKPGMVIGQKGANKAILVDELKKLTGRDIVVNVFEVKQRDLSAQLCAEDIALQLEKRIAFRRAMKQVMSRAMKSGALGIKTACSGRLGGAEIARTEHYHEGTIPLQTLRADIDYGFAEAKTTYGRIGVKVWIYKGEVLPAPKKTEGGAN